MIIADNDFPKMTRRDLQAAHLAEVKMLNTIDKLMSEIEDGAGNARKLNRNINKLLSHTVDHFAHEERLMVASGFPPYAMHKAAHEQLLSYMRSTIQAWQSSGELDPLSAFIRDELPVWMKQHIATMDAVTDGYLSQIGR